MAEWQERAGSTFGEAGKTILWLAVAPVLPLPRPILIGSNAVKSFLETTCQQREKVTVAYDEYGAATSYPNRSCSTVGRNGTISLGQAIHRLPANAADYSPEIPNAIAFAFEKFAELREALGIKGETLVAAGLIGIRGLYLPFLSTSKSSSSPDSAAPSGVDALFLADFIRTKEPALLWIRKHVADFFWNAGGYPECRLFTNDGEPRG